MADENKPAEGNQPPISEPASKPGDADAQIKAAVDRALADERRAVAEKAKADKDAADAEQAKQRGEFQKLYEAEKADRAKEAAQNRSLRASLALRDHLAAKHPDYIGSAIDIAPHIPSDADGDALSKAVEKAASDFVARNPRGSQRGGGVPLPQGPFGGKGEQQKTGDVARDYLASQYRGPNQLQNQN